MLVCSACGTRLRVSGRPCPHCGARGSIDERFFEGEVRDPPEGTGEAEAAPVEATASGVLPESERAWSPWLAGLVAVVLGATAGALVAARNLSRLPLRGADPWRGAWICFGVHLAALLAMGFVARADAGLAIGLVAVVNLVVGALLVRWQWEPVQAQRASRPGHHTPGSDAFAIFLLALVVGLLLAFVGLRLGDRISDGALGATFAQLTADG